MGLGLTGNVGRRAFAQGLSSCLQGPGFGGHFCKKYWLLRAGIARGRDIHVLMLHVLWWPYSLTSNGEQPTHDKISGSNC